MTTKIRWTNETWNPTTGCSHVSPGCERCYAEALSLRMGWSAKPWKAQNAAENVILHPERLGQPAVWERRAVRTGQPIRVFVDSMSDLFHELIPWEYIDRVFDVMEACPHVIFQILTKRPQKMQLYMLGRLRQHGIKRNYAFDGLGFPEWQAQMWASRDLPNIWLGTSVEDQRRADERIPLLINTPAAVRFLSCEPLLGPVSLRDWLFVPGTDIADFDLHWIIAGGESGPKFRPMAHDWARTLRDQCLEAGVPFFFKQSSGPRTEMGQELDGQRWEQFPAALSSASERLP